MRSDTAHATDFAEILQSGESLTSEGTALAVPKKSRSGRSPTLQWVLAWKFRWGSCGALFRR